MIQVKNLVRTFIDGENEIQVLKGIDLRVLDGEFIAIIGRSGAGKSTLLYQISLLDKPTDGSITIDGIDVLNLSSEERTFFRLSKLGYVFQDYALLPEMTALENVALPLLMQGISQKEAYQKATEALVKVNLGHRLNSLPSKLSGGEQQRVSIARAIGHEPKILFADEPTANLDNESSRIILEIFKDLHRKGQTIVMVTHEEEYTKEVERIIKIDDGKIVSEIKN